MTTSVTTMAAISMTSSRGCYAPGRNRQLYKKTSGLAYCREPVNEFMVAEARAGSTKFLQSISISPIVRYKNVGEAARGIRNDGILPLSRTSDVSGEDGSPAGPYQPGYCETWHCHAVGYEFNRKEIWNSSKRTFRQFISNYRINDNSKNALRDCGLDAFASCLVVRQ
jgi:hypothetical protein